MNKINTTVLAIGAHPDDVEFLCAGTLALLKNKGWNIHIATMTPGDCGSATLSREEISCIRKKEATLSASMLDSGYDCMESEDLFISYDKKTLTRVTRLIRKVKPTIVITMSPSDYMVDHEMTSKIVQTSCFAAGVVNVETDNVKAYDKIPYLYYMDPIEGKDKFGHKIEAGIIVDISDVITIKEKMLAAHKSQREWLLQHHGMDEYIIAMKTLSADRGEEIKKNFAEGFRQHLGHAFPQDDILKSELGEAVHLM